MTTESRQQTFSDAAAAPTTVRRQHTLGWIGYGFYVLRRWPVIPALIIITLLVCAVFASQLRRTIHTSTIFSTAIPLHWQLASRVSFTYWAVISSGVILLSRIIHGRGFRRWWLWSP